ncbi:MAG TPA: hypothetical protein H9881_06305 [Candidatus Stackebrandtia excrementipullorum]|nr:hypothetical protein [Candidatus Stackebrandtia excrementipullorum]
MNKPVKVNPQRSRLRRMIGLGNRLVVMVLRSPAHRVLSGRLMLLEYTGAKTGRRYRFPIAYHRWGVDDGEVLAMSRGTGWPHRVKGRRVELLVAGRACTATAEVVDELEAVADLLEEFCDRYGPVTASRLMLGLPKDRKPTRRELLDAAAKARWVRFTVT